MIRPPISQLYELDKRNLKVARIRSQVQEARREIVAAEAKSSAIQTECFIQIYMPRLKPVVPHRFSHTDDDDDEKLAVLTQSVFSTRDITRLILIHLGPRELHLVTRVARVFEPIVSDAFLQFAMVHITRYANAINDSVVFAEHLRAQKRYQRLINSYEEIPEAQREPVSRMLSLWDHVMTDYDRHRSLLVVYDKYQTNLDMDKKMHLDYVFLHDPVTDCIRRARDLNLFRITNFDQLKRHVASRWKTEFPALPFAKALKLVPHFVNLVRYEEWRMANLEPITDVLSVEEAFLIENGQVHSLVARGCGVCYSDPVPPAHRPGLFGFPIRAHVDATKGNVPRHGPPFFDHYVIRAKSQFSVDTRVSAHELVAGKDPYRYKMSIGVHFDRVYSSVAEQLDRHEQQVATDTMKK